MPDPHPARRWAWFAAAAAAVVTIIFATIGDGVGSKGDGWRAWVIDYAHTVTWAMLTVMFALLAASRTPTWLTSAIGWTALATYIAFLLTLATTPA